MLYAIDSRDNCDPIIFYWAEGGIEGYNLKTMVRTDSPERFSGTNLFSLETAEINLEENMQKSASEFVDSIVLLWNKGLVMVPNALSDAVIMRLIPFLGLRTTLNILGFIKLNSWARERDAHLILHHRVVGMFLMFEDEEKREQMFRTSTPALLRKNKDTTKRVSLYMKEAREQEKLMLEAVSHASSETDILTVVITTATSGGLIGRQYFYLNDQSSDEEILAVFKLLQVETDTYNMLYTWLAGSYSVTGLI